MLHRLAHGAPAGLFVAVPLDHAQNLEFPGIVDRGLDPQDILMGLGQFRRQIAVTAF
jgi:hypothetical protein